MKLVEMTEYLVKELVNNKDMVTVKEFPSDEDNKIIIEVLVSQDDLPRVIGKGGKLSNAVRTLVQASSYTKDNKKVRINIDSF